MAKDHHGDSVPLLTDQVTGKTYYLVSDFNLNLGFTPLNSTNYPQLFKPGLVEPGVELEATGSIQPEWDAVETDFWLPNLATQQKAPFVPEKIQLLAVKQLQLSHQGSTILWQNGDYIHKEGGAPVWGNPFAPPSQQ